MSKMAKTRNIRHIMREGEKNKDEGAGRSNKHEDEGGGLEDNVQGMGAGLDDVMQDEGAGLDNKVKGAGAGLDDKVQDEVVRRIRGGDRRATRWVKVNLGGEELDLYCDTGSSITIITPAMYRRSMGKVVAAKSYLQAWGSEYYLDTKVMFKTTLTTTSGGGRGPGHHQLQPGGAPTARRRGGQELRGRQECQHRRHAQEGRQRSHHKEAPAPQGQDKGQGRGQTDRQWV